MAGIEQHVELDELPLGLDIIRATPLEAPEIGVGVRVRTFHLLLDSCELRSPRVRITLQSLMRSSDGTATAV